MTLKKTLAWLKALGDEKVRAQYKKQGAGDNQFGVRMGDIRKLAKEIKTDHKLALELWETGNLDARQLAIGDKLGLYRDDPVSQGCASPFAPIWINDMVSRQGD